MRNGSIVSKWAVGGVFLLGGAALAFAALAGFFDRSPFHYYPAAEQGGGKTAVVFLSGDMGLRIGMGPAVISALNREGFPVVSVSSPAAFGRTRDQVYATGLLKTAIDDALERTGARRVVIVAQSFGADVAVSALRDLPASAKSKIGQIVLIVPGKDIFFRADPIGFAYLGTPAEEAKTALNDVHIPVTCIYGVEEQDSLCPLINESDATVVALPGGHFLDNDRDRLASTVMKAIGRDSAPVLAEQKPRSGN